MEAIRPTNGADRELAFRGEILGREVTCDALVVPTGAMAQIGQIPREALDPLVDPKNRTLHVNPESPDSPLLDLLRAS